jgi:hypothetical protein
MDAASKVPALVDRTISTTQGISNLLKAANRASLERKNIPFTNLHLPTLLDLGLIELLVHKFNYLQMQSCATCQRLCNVQCTFPVKFPSERWLQPKFPDLQYVCF